jgi:tetratricopeptide (TPR) repeat protein
MASLIPGYEYDIFISYRQKDNKGDKWVSRFVEALKTELESTFKEDVSVYFDENPHDRLQETHNVDKSLEGKLRCLIFIPVLSQTYCDPNSYAWQYEFLAFLKLAGQDSIGKDIKLRSGNVASRILPIRIHDLEQEDIKLYEKETGSVLRALDFVFKTATGVSRPLKEIEDHPQDNLNRTFYSDQINKVGHAVKEIILGLKAEIPETLKEKSPLYEPLQEATKKTWKETLVKHDKSPIRKSLIGAVGVVILVVLAVLVIQNVIQAGRKKNITDADGRISITVTVFDNNSNDSTLHWLTKGIPELIRNNLTGSKELSVQNSQTMYELYESMGKSQNASIAPSLSREAAIKLKTRTYITGSFQIFGEDILTYVKLVDTKSNELLWTGSIEGNLDKYKYLADSLSDQLKGFLEIKSIKQKSSQEFVDVNTNSPEALRKYVGGMQLMINGNFRLATTYFEESYLLDTSFTLAALYASYSYSYLRDFVPSIKWTKIAYRGKERLSFDYKIWIETWRACNILKDADSAQYYNDLLTQSQIKSRLFWWDLGYNYLVLEQYQKALNAFEKVGIINSEWEEYWKYLEFYTNFGYCCHKCGLHEKEATVYETGLKLFPDNMGIIYCQAICALSANDTLKATGLINKLIKIGNAQKWPASSIELGYGNLYAEAGFLEKAEIHYRNALRLDPNNYSIINTLALFLVNNDRNIYEAEKFANRSLQIKPDNTAALRIYGLVLYKQGKYEESLQILQQAYAKYLVWFGPLFREIKKAKQAVASQKTN